MECWQERVFYFWRHGLYGHVVSFCNKVYENNKSNLFLPLWSSLADNRQRDLKNIQKIDTLLKFREDLKLLREICEYEILKGSEAEKSRKSILEILPKANTFSKASSAFICILFSDYSLCSEIVSNSDETELLTLNAWNLMLTGDCLKAKKIFENLKEQDRGESCLNLYGFWLCYSHLGMTSESIDLYTHIIGKYNFPEMLIESISSAYYRKNFDMVLKSLIDVQKEEDFSLEYYYIRAVYYLVMEGDIKEALSCISKVIENVEMYEKYNWRFNMKTAFLFLTISCGNASIIDQTIKLAQMAVDFKPTSANALFVLGYYFAMTKKYALAVKAFSKGFSLDPINVLGNEANLMLQIEMNRIDEANDMLDFIPHDKDLPLLALELKLEQSDAFKMHVLDLIKQRTADYSKEKCEFAYENELSNERPLNAIISYRFDVISNIFDELAFNESYCGISYTVAGALKLAPGLAPLKFNYLVSLFIDEEYSKAVDVARYMMISEWSYKREWVLAIAASSLYKMGDLKFAQRCIDNINEIGCDIKKVPEFTLLWAKLQLAKNKTESTINYIIEYCENAEMSFKASIGFVDILIDEGNYSKAMSFLKDISTKYTQQREKAEIVIRQASIFAAIGKREKAFSTLNKLKHHKKYSLKVIKSEAWLRLKFMNDESMFIKAFEDNLKEEKTDENYILLADAYSEIAMFEEASKIYQSLLTRNPFVATKYINSLVKAHKFEKAIEAYKEYTPQYTDTLSFVKLMIKLKRYSAAKECLDSSNYLRNRMQLLAAEYNELYGIVAMKKNDLDLAAQSYIKALAIYKVFQPKGQKNCFVDDISEKASNVAVELGHIAEKKDGVENAIGYYHDAFELCNSNSSAAYELYKYYENRNPIKCISIFEEFIKHNTDNERIALLVTNLEVKDYTLFIKSLKAILDSNPKYYRSGVRYIELLSRSGQLQQAEEYIKTLKSDLSPGSHFVRGLYFMLNRENSKAFKYFDVITGNRRWGIAAKTACFTMTINPNSLYIWDTKKPLASEEALNKGEAYLSTMNVDDSTMSLLKAELLCARNTDNSVKKALSIYTSLRDNQSVRAAAFLGIGRCQLRLGNLENAKASIGVLMQIRHTHETYSYFEEGYLIRSFIAAEHGNYLAANHDTALAINLNKSSIKAWEMSANYGMKSKLYGDAASAYLKCWELCGKKNIDIGYDLAYCLMLGGRAEEALTVCRTILDENPLYKDIREKIIIPAYRMLK